MNEALVALKEAYDKGDINMVAKIIYHETSHCLIARNPNSQATLLDLIASFLEHVENKGYERGLVTVSDML